MTNQPYPQQLVEMLTLADGETVCLRPSLQIAVYLPLASLPKDN